MHWPPNDSYLSHERAARDADGDPHGEPHDYHYACGDFVFTIMTDDTDHPPSPCIALCKMDAERRYCTGCWRTLDEIAGWSRASADDKRRIWLAVRARAAHAHDDPNQ